MKKKLKNIINKSSLIILLLLFLITFVIMIKNFIIKDYRSAFISMFTIFIISLPDLMEKKFELKFTYFFKIIIYFFIFSNSILGEVCHYFIDYPYWDFVFHLIGGFIFVGVCLSLIHKYSLSLLLVIILTISFSMTVSISWEFVEYGADKIFYTDMQKDAIISNISSVKVDKVKNYKEEDVKDICKTVLYDENGDILKVIKGGYLDIGLNDTMKDLGASFLGAVIFWLINYLSIYNKKKVVNLFLIKKDMS